MSFKKNKYPISRNNQQCLGPCYYANTKAIHPITLDPITYNEDFCPISKLEILNKTTGKKEFHFVDTCYKPTDDETSNKKDIEINMLIPYIDFKTEQFLKIYYNIYSFEDGINWIETNKFTPIVTRIRILNSILKSYGNKVDIIDNRVTDFFIEVIKSQYIKKILLNLSKYIIINNNIVELGKSNNNIEIDNNVKINYIIKTFINNEEIHKFIIKYLRYRKDQWENINNYIENMINDLIEYIINKINLTLK
jgi:hypothetical protein